MKARLREVKPAQPEGVCDWLGKMGVDYHSVPTTLVAVMCPRCDVYIVRKLCDSCMNLKITPGLRGTSTYQCGYCKSRGLRADQVWKVIGKYEPHG